MLDSLMLIAEFVMGFLILLTLGLMLAPFVVYLLKQPVEFYSYYMEKYWRWISKKLGF